MKSKGILGVALLSALSVPQAALAFCDDCWGSVGLKQWMSTLNAGDGALSGSSQMLSLTAGNGKFFANVSLNPRSTYDGGATASNISVSRSQGSINFGYLIGSGFSGTAGLKQISEKYIYANGQSVDTSSITPFFGNVGVSYFYKIPDSKFSINGTAAYGERSIAPDINAYLYPGVLDRSSAYKAIDVGSAYSITKDFAVNIFYRFEQWDTVYATAIGPAPYIATLEKRTMKLGGPGIGVSYSF